MGPSVQPRVIGRYAIYDKIASGGMASVHFGRLVGSAGFTRTVAIKRLHPHLAEEPGFLATMIDEARLAARIHHPNVVPTLDVVTEGGELLVVMEYVRGDSLARLLHIESARKRRTPLPIASAIVAGALHGLNAAHEAKSDQGVPLGIVHRDVSPQNILVGADGVPRVIDFGVAKAAGRLQTTREGVVKGKMAYMAPEQLRAGEVTCLADVYAMAVVLWEMLAGKRMFPGANDAALFGKVLEGVKEPPSVYAPGIPQALDDLVMRGLAADPSDRFPSAAAMAEMLERLVPPALPTEVGRWVQDVAAETLARRSALLADIESSSGAATVPANSSTAPASTPRAEPSPLPEDAATVASQPSSLTLETPKPAQSEAPGPRRVGRVALVGGAAAFVVAASVVAVVWSRGPAAAVAESPAGAASSAIVPPPPPPSPPPSAEPPPSPPIDSAAVGATAAASATVAAPKKPPTPSTGRAPPAPVPTKRKGEIPADWN